MSDSMPIRVQRDGIALYVTLVRPDERNALNSDAIEKLTSIFGDVGDARVIVLAGAGPSFCAGADLKEVRASVDWTDGEAQEQADAMSSMLEAVNDCPAPVICAVQGHALGGGAALAACSDIVIAHEDAVFGFSEVKLGLVPTVVLPVALDRLGARQCRRYLLTGERFDAHTALRIGLVDEVAGDLDAAVAKMLGEFAEVGPWASRETKRLILDRAAKNAGPRYRLALPTDNIEGDEGLKAFLDRERPSWSN